MVSPPSPLAQVAILAKLTRGIKVIVHRNREAEAAAALGLDRVFQGRLSVCGLGLGAPARSKWPSWQ